MKSHLELAFLLPFWIHTCQLEAWALCQFQMLRGRSAEDRPGHCKYTPLISTASPEKPNSISVYLGKVSILLHWTCFSCVPSGSEVSLRCVPYLRPFEMTP